MLACWREVLGEQVGAHDDFIDVGGDSISALAVLARVHDRWDVWLTLAELFAAPTPALLAARLAERLADRSAGGVTRRTAARVGPVEPVRAGPHSGRSGLDAPPGGDPAWRSLSFAEERLWFFEQLIPDTALNTIPSASRVRGELNMPALDAALSTVVDRHDVLRTRYLAVDGAPRARIEATTTAGVQRIRCASEAELQRTLRMLAREPVPVDQAPLLRLGCLSLSDTEHVLLLRVHHLVADAWSLNLLWDELSRAYRSASDATPAGPAGPPPQGPAHGGYAEHVRRQRQELSSAATARHLAFWSAELAGAPSLLELPLDRHRPPTQRHHGAKLYRSLPPELADGVRDLGRQCGASVFMVLLAGLAGLLARLSGQDDVVVGVPVSGRDRLDTETAIGLFVNMLPVRIRTTAQPDFATLVARVRDTMLRVLEHRELPFERLVEFLAPERELSYSPVFQVMADLQTRGLAPTLPGTEVRRERVDTGTARFDLSVSFEQAGTGLNAVFTYDTDLFDPDTIASTADRLELLLAGALRDPQAPLERLPLVTAEELERWATVEPARGEGRTVVEEVFRVAASAPPGAVAVSDGGCSWTYRQLTAAVAGQARALREAGVAPGSVVAVCVRRGAPLVAALLGVHLAALQLLAARPGATGGATSDAPPPGRGGGRLLLGASVEDMAVERLAEVIHLVVDERAGFRPAR